MKFKPHHRASLRSQQHLQLTEVEYVRLFAHRPTVTTRETIWPGPSLAARSDLPFLTGSNGLVAVSDSAADTATGPGAGAEGVMVQYMAAPVAGADPVIHQEKLVLNGVTPSAATAYGAVGCLSAWATGNKAAQGASNVGNITIKDSVTGDAAAYIAAGQGQTQQCWHWVPAGTTGFLKGFHLESDGTKAIGYDIWFITYVYDGGVYWTCKRNVLKGVGQTVAAIDRVWENPTKIPASSFVWMTADVAGAGADITAGLYLDLVQQ